MKSLSIRRRFLQFSYKGCLLSLVLVSGIFIIGCIEPYNIEVPKAGGNLVVDGFISTEFKSHEIRINLSTGYNDEELLNPYDAIVTIVSDRGDVIYLMKGEPGKYYTEPLAGEVGRSYKIIIESQEGDIYESDYEPLIAVNPFEEIQYEYRNDGFAEPGILVYVKTVESPENQNYVMWNYIGHQEITQLYGDPYDTAAGEILYYCVTAEKCNGCINISSDELYKGSTHNQFIAKVPYTATSKYIIKIDKFSLSPKVYDFYSKINRIVNNSGTIFDTPPTLVRGNIRNINDEDEIVHGYFYATDVYSKIFRIRRDIFSDPPDLLPRLIPKECTKGELACLLSPLQLPDPPPCANQTPVYWDLF